MEASVRVTAVALLTCVFVASHAEAAFMRARPLEPTNSRFMLEIVMEEDLLLVVAGITIVDSIESIDTSVSAFSQDEHIFGFGPSGNENFFTVREPEGLTVSRGDLVPIAVLTYGQAAFITEIPYSPLYFIRGLPPGETGVIRDFQTPIDRLFPGRELPEPALILLLLAAVWAMPGFRA